MNGLNNLKKTNKMKKLATKLTPAIKAWIKEEFGSDRYENESENCFFCFPNFTDFKGYKDGAHAIFCLDGRYTEVSESEFLAEFGKKPIIQILAYGQWIDLNCQHKYRIKPTPDYSPEIEALQVKAKENGMSVTINFEKL